ncbi:MAG: hypothetical protein AAFP20_09005 [Cyanobacteria bacterium J06614_10]
MARSDGVGPVCSVSGCTHPDRRCAPATLVLVGIPCLGAHSIAPGTDAGAYRSRGDLLLMWPI